MIITVVSIVAIGVAIALYLWWKDRDDYDEKKIIVWSVAAAGALGLLFGIIFVIWGAFQKRIYSGYKKSIEETGTAQIKTQQEAKRREVQEAYQRAPRQDSPPVIGPPMKVNPVPSTGPDRLKTPPKPDPKSILKGGTSKTETKTPVKKVTFGVAGSSSRK